MTMVFSDAGKSGNLRQQDTTRRLVMNQSGSFRIQAEAAEALAEWKAFFAEQVAVKAKELAKESNQPGLITLGHYRHAAVLAAQSLAIEVQEKGSNDGRQEAA
jgi:hypothetical protein